MAIQLLGGAETKVVDAFHAVDLGAPFKVILHNSIIGKFDRITGDMIDYTIPDFEGLVRTVVMARTAHDYKLSGPELKYIRKAVGVTQKELANALDFAPEHLSKVESGKLPLSPSAEKLARIFIFKAAAKHHKLPDGKLKDMLDELLEKVFAGLETRAADKESELELHFHRGCSDQQNSVNDDVIANDDDPDQDCIWTDSLEKEAA